jgi:hypothetical protein
MTVFLHLKPCPGLTLASYSLEFKNGGQPQHILLDLTGQVIRSNSPFFTCCTTQDAAAFATFEHTCCTISSSLAELALYVPAFQRVELLGSYR